MSTNIIKKLGITPGPWKIEKCRDYCGSQHCNYHFVGPGTFHQGTGYEYHDAKLVATATEMLEALITLYDDWKYIEYYNPDTFIRPIIEKATGRTWIDVKELIKEE